MPAPTDRHWRLAAAVIDLDHDQARQVAELLADQDAHRVPIESVGAAHLHGRRTALRDVLTEADQLVEQLTNELGVEADAEHSLRARLGTWVQRELDKVDDPKPAEILPDVAAFRAWIHRTPELDRAAVLTALDAWEARR